MRSFLLLRRPLSRRTLVFCHVTVQLGLLLGGIAWLARDTPWLTPTTWQAAWPTLALGVGMLLLAMVGVRLFAEVLMLPHHLAGLRQGTPGAVMTRSFARRPAVHAPEDAWVNNPETRPTLLDEEAVGSARVVQPRRTGTQRHAGEEPTLDFGKGAPPDAGHEKRRQEPGL